MPLLPLVLTAAFGAAPAAAPAPDTVAGPVGRRPLRTWVYAEDPAADGEARGMADGRFAGRRVQVPHSANPARPGTAAAIRAFRGSTGWYRTTIRTGAGVYAIRFESVASRAEVWIDGTRVAAHQRAYEPFEARLALPAGRHRVVVHADWRSPAAQSRLGLHRTWFNWGGMNREVTLRRVGPSEITGAAVRTRLRGRDALVTVSARVRNTTGAARRVPVVARLTHAGRVQLVDLGRAAIAAGASRTLQRRVVVRRPALWAPGHGRLYDLRIVVPGESAWHARVGLREVRFDGGVLRVNGRRTVLRGASVHEDVPGRGDALRPADMDRIVAELRAIGANATRAQHPLSPGLLERLDRAGIAVWQQIGPVDSPGEWLATTPQLVAQAREDVRDDLRANRLHPSILAWSLGCEIAGNGRPGQGAFVDAAARELHAADPGRGVAVDLWTDHVPARPGLLYRSLDAVGVTSYLGWYEAPRASLARQGALIRARVRDLRRRFPGKAVVVAELGAEGIAAMRPEARGGRDYQAALLSAQLRALQRAPGLSGAFAWLLRDFAVNPGFRGGSAARLFPGLRTTRGRNEKGLFDEAGRPKPAAIAVRRALRGFS